MSNGFLDVVKFLAVSSGTGSFVVSAASDGYQTPASAGATNGATYSYRAESTDLSEWEIGTGTYATSGTTLARTTVLASSTGSKVSFSSPPTVSVTLLSGDILDASKFTSGLVPTARLGTGTASSTTALFGDQTYKAIPVPTGFLSIDVITASATVTIPTGAVSARVRMAGSGATGTTTISGASGGYLEKWLTGLTPGNTLTATINAPGTAVLASGTETISTLTAAGNATGSTSGGDLNLDPGGNASVASASFGTAQGGSTPIGQGGSLTFTASGFGGGGATTVAHNAGGPAGIIIEWFAL